MFEDTRSRAVRLSDQDRQALVSRLLKNRRTGTAQEIVSQPRTSKTSNRFPVSAAQQRIWVIQQVLPDTTAFNVALAFHLGGPLDVDALTRSLSDVAERHEALRTTFVLQDGEPVQQVEAAFEVIPRVEDLRHLPAAERTAEAVRRAREEALRPWDLTAGALQRVFLWRVGEDEHVFLVLLHHIICDGWSLNIMIRELFASYGARAAGSKPTLPVMPIQYADYSVWHRGWLESEACEKQLGYWCRRMADAPMLRLPAGTAEASEAPIARALARRVVVPGELARSVKALSRSEGVTTFMTLLSAFAVLLAGYADQEDIVVGSPVASRTRPELENVIGCFMNPLPFRVDLAGNPTFRALLLRVRDTALEGYAHQDVPFDRILRAARPKRESGAMPLYQSMFLLHNFPWEFRDAAGRNDSAALAITPLPLLVGDFPEGEETTLAADPVFPVALDLAERVESISGFVEYAPEFAQVMARFPEDFARVLEAAVADPGIRVGDLPIGTRRPIRTAARTAAARALTDHALDVSAAFEAQAARTPDAVALVDGDERLTYQALAGRVNRLAAYVQSRLPGAERPVGLLLERSTDAIVSLLAVLRSGAPYMPLDPALPIERLSLMLDHAQVGVILTRSDLLDRLAVNPRVLDGRAVIRLDADAAAIDGHPVVPPPAISPEQLAYVLYTSGSTGRPKAVAIPRGALSNYARVAGDVFGFDPQDRVLQFASLNFDAAVEEIFPTLVSGGALVLRSDAMLSSAPAFLSACSSWGITVLDLPTAYWHELTAQLSRTTLRIPDSVRLVIIGGEKALASRVREWRAAVGRRIRLVNTYGPTEATVVATMCDLSELDRIPDEVPIGTAMPNAETSIRDRGVSAVAPGATGELCIGGRGLARGYLNDPALTAERFVPDPDAIRPGARLYRTGDLVRVAARDTLEFAGRVDNQVKLRGHRIEPGEIEAVLVQHGGMREAAVVLREDHPGDRRLVAYLVPFEPASLSVADIRRFLLERVPEYMVPSAFVVLGALPRTIQMKVDRGALPPPVASDASAEQRFVAPRNDLERKVAALWGDLLHREQVGVLENFFDIGGHSLLLIQLHARLCETFGDDLALVDLFRFPTVQSQAAHLSHATATVPAFSASRDRAARQRQAFRRLGK